MKTHWKKLIAGSLAAAICLLSGCTSAPDTRDDPLSGYDVNSLPFNTRVPDAVTTTAAATQTPVPNNTSIVTLPQDWQNEPAPGNDTSTNVPTKKPTQAPTPTPTQAPVPTRTSYIKLEQGDTGPEVQRLQQRLIELGYLSGTADGNYGANTKNAVKRFQKALGISQTGVAYVSLQEKLFMSTAPSYQVDLSATATPDPNAAARFTVLVKGDKGEEVLKLQQRLIELGYLSGTADGDFGANTENAVKRFQSVLGVSQTGVASAVMQSQLFSSTAPYAPAPTQAPTQVPTPTPKPQSTLSYQQLNPGDTGDAVVQMQQRLKELGYFSGTATGNYFRETTESVKRFQKAIGMSETGTASSAMLIELYSANAPLYSDSVQSDPTSVPGGYTLLQRGSTGTEVLNLQKRLISLGYLTGNADGSYGTGTENAVKLFQKQVGFAQNGIASVGLQNLLFSAAAPVYTPDTPTSVPTTVPTQAPSDRYPQLNPGDSNPDVKMMQTRLKQLGFFAGQLGGNYQTKTTASVKLFQAAIGMPETGIATSEMLEVLYSDDAPRYEDVESDYITLEKLDSGIQVLNLQKRLKELGYLTGTADGDFGSQTENAIKAFQQQVGLEISGKATPETQTILYSNAAPSAPVASTPVPTQVPTQVPTRVPQQTGYTTLDTSSTGEAVKNLQTRLKQLGFFDGNIGGNYLVKTETAVKLFQAQHGFPADGIATAAMQQYLFSADASAYDGSAYIALSKGMTGPAVRNLQAALISAGYLSGTADGDFGAGTEKAVKKLQNALGFEDDGVAGIHLQGILFSGEGMPSATSAPTQVPTQVPTQIPTKVPSTPTQPPVSGQYRTIKNGMSGEDVKAIQMRLTELGYYDGLHKGNYLGITELSMKLFQAQNGFAPDGVATPSVQEALFSASAPRYNATVYVDLKKGDEGIAVQRLQQRLIELGYLTGSADGEYGGGTANGVKKFQQQIGYHTSNGEADAALQRSLFAANAPAYGSSTPAAPTAVPSNGNSNNSSSYRTITAGTSGEDVKAIQMRLTELGYYDGLHKGNYKSITELSVKLFQAQNGFPADGIATPAVQEAMFAASAPRYNATAYVDMKVGDEGIAVKTLQSRLIALGYLSGTADGDYGEGTKNAVKKFQKQISFRSTNGEATAELQNYLFSADAPAYGDAAPSVPTAPAATTVPGGSSAGKDLGGYNDYRTITHGMNGEDIKAIQRRLTELGYFYGDIGGNYLTKTQAAVELFQAAIGVSPDGVATPELQMRILSASAPSYKPADAPEQLVILARGDDGSMVKKLQKRLIALGWLKGTADGDYGAGTEEALKQFQYRVGLDADGIAGIEVQDILYSASAPHYVAYTEIQPGARGDGVLMMQLRLIELGYLDSKAANMDGIYGNGLKNALTQLQIESGVDPAQANGIATVELQSFLFSGNADFYAR